MASLALLKADLNALSKSWVLRGWLIALGLTEFFLLSGALIRNRIMPMPASELLGAQLVAFLFVWSTIIIVLSAGSVSLETDIISDSILSRACTRTQYIASKLFSRAIVVLGVYLLTAGIAGFFAWRYAASDMTLTTLTTGIGVVGLALLLLVMLGVAFSVLFNNTIVAVIGMLLLWYVASPVFSFLGADYLSPSSLMRNMPRILKDPNVPQVMDATATASSIVVTFSKRLDPDKAELPDNYQLELPNSSAPVLPTAAAYDKTKDTVTLSGLKLPEGEKVKVTVRGVTDPGGSVISPAADSVTATVQVEQKEANKVTVKNAIKEVKKTAASEKVVEKDRTPPRVLRCTATTSSLKVVFSKDIDGKDAEDLASYIVESPPGTPREPRAATYNRTTRTTLLSGFTFADSDPVKVTVKDLKDTHGNMISTGGNSATYSEVTTWKYVLGFGIPAILAALLAVLGFARRDL